MLQQVLQLLHTLFVASLAIVAPGIAEALFATALGLLAAIPAVVAYNKFASDSRKYLNKLENFTQSFSSAV